MEFAAAALASIGSTLASGASALGTALVGAPAALGAPAIPGLLGSLGTASTAASILSGTATVASALMASRAGEEKSKSLAAQAEDAGLDANVATLQGVDRQNSLKAQLVQAIGERDVAASASGVDLSFGTPAIARAQAVKEGERALAIDDQTTALRVARLNERAAQLRGMSRSALSTGYASAAVTGLEGAAKIARRG